MRIPDRLKVGPFWYAIERPELIDRYAPETDGMCDYGRLEIKVENGLPAPRAEETFFHELVHAVDEFMCTQLSEEQMDQLSKGLYMVFKENGLLAD